jgi:gluconolactonase
MRQRASVISLLLWLASFPGCGHADEGELAAILAGGAKLERAAGGLKFAEGPVWDGKSLLVSDVLGDTVYRLAGDGGLKVAITPSHWANGHSWALDGSLLAAEHASGEVTRRAADGKTSTLVSRYQGKRLNSPNDVIVRSDGLVYFTDPPFGLKPPYGPVERPAELAFAGVYRFDPKKNELTLLTRDLKYPNGIAFSPDEQKLYLSDTASQKIWVYDVAADGSIGSGREFADLTISNPKGVVDGMKVDKLGHLYSVCPAGVCILSPEGKLIGSIAIPERATDVAWGGEHHDILFVTATTSVYQIQTRMTGAGSGIK